MKVIKISLPILLALVIALCLCFSLLSILAEGALSWQLDAQEKYTEDMYNQWIEGIFGSGATVNPDGSISIGGSDEDSSHDHEHESDSEIESEAQSQDIGSDDSSASSENDVSENFSTQNSISDAEHSLNEGIYSDATFEKIEVVTINNEEEFSYFYSVGSSLLGSGSLLLSYKLLARFASDIDWVWTIYRIICANAIPCAVVIISIILLIVHLMSFKSGLGANKGFKIVLATFSVASALVSAIANLLSLPLFINVIKQLFNGFKEHRGTVMFWPELVFNSIVLLSFIVSIITFALISLTFVFFAITALSRNSGNAPAKPQKAISIVFSVIGMITSFFFTVHMLATEIYSLVAYGFTKDFVSVLSLISAILLIMLTAMIFVKFILLTVSSIISPKAPSAQKPIAYSETDIV